jgi:Fe2+ or Zn2+ uptake regulation protein
MMAVLEHAGLRQTRLRQALAARVAHLGTEDKDCTIEDLWQNVRTSPPRMGSITAFRMIELLVKSRGVWASPGLPEAPVNSCM